MTNENIELKIVIYTNKEESYEYYQTHLRCTFSVLYLVNTSNKEIKPCSNFRFEDKFNRGKYVNTSDIYAYEIFDISGDYPERLWYEIVNPNEEVKNYWEEQLRIVELNKMKNEQIKSDDIQDYMLITVETEFKKYRFCQEYPEDMSIIEFSSNLTNSINSSDQISINSIWDNECYIDCKDIISCEIFDLEKGLVLDRLIFQSANKVNNFTMEKLKEEKEVIINKDEQTLDDLIILEFINKMLDIKVELPNVIVLKDKYSIYEFDAENLDSMLSFMSECKLTSKYRSVNTEYIIWYNEKDYEYIRKNDFLITEAIDNIAENFMNERLFKLLFSERSIINL